MLLTGCSLFGPKEKPIQLDTKPVDKTPLALLDPAPLRLNSPKWIVITPDNIDSVWKELQDKKVDLVLFALTDDGYEALSVDMAEIRKLIATQRAMIIKYREYYESNTPKHLPKNK